MIVQISPVRNLPAQMQPGFEDDERAMGRPSDERDSLRNLLPGHHVLIVEDNYLVAQEFAAVLEEAGYLVDDIAVSADEAIAACDRTKPHFVLMDVRLLGNQDGVSAALEIRRRFGIRSLFVTANDDFQLRERARAAHPFGWLAKPVTGAVLVAKLRSLGEAESA